MSSSPPPGLFPLPLNVFEKYMLADDRPEYPMAFIMQMEVSGRLRREVFEAALEESLNRHPLFCALLDRSRWGAPCWVSAGDLKPLLDWNCEGAPLICPNGERFDLTREVGLRVWVREGMGSAQVTFHVHHACCDGLGGLQFMGDLLAAYGIRTAPEGKKPVLQPLDPMQLRDRGHFTVEFPESISRWRIFRDTVREAAKWLGQGPTPLHAPAAVAKVGKRPPPPFPGIMTHVFDTTQTQCLRQAARRQKASLNDLMLRDLFLTASRWNEQVRPGRPGRWLRINMPQNLRERRHDQMPAADVMTQAFIARRPQECADPETLLQSIVAETALVKRWRMGLYFIGGLTMADKIPGLLKLGMKLLGNRCYATSVLTYVGEATRRFTATFPRQSGRIVAGDLVLEKIVGVPPIRPQTFAGFSASLDRGELVLSVRGDAHGFAEEDTARLLALYVDQLSQSQTEG